MNSNISRISEVMEDIKQDITDSQYKIIMESLMTIKKNPNLYKNHRSNKFICLFEWLDTKLELTNYSDDGIKRKNLYKYVIKNFYNNLYYENIDFVKQVLKIFFIHETKYQNSNSHFIYVKYK